MLKPDYQKTNQLQHLREAAGLSQQEAAVCFGLKDRRSVGDWERGKSQPHLSRYQDFVHYLLDKLGLRKRPQEFFQLWQDLMVAEWHWPMVSSQELQAYFPSSLQRNDLSIPATNNTTLLSVPYLTPPLPSYGLVGRDALLDEVRQHIMARGQSPDVVLYGLPGVGKTALAATLALDPEVQAHFYDGILWAGLGRHPDIMSLLGIWGTAVGLTSTELNQLNHREARAAAVSAAIGPRRMLLIMDDIWQVETALAFKLGGPNCTYLMTTRQPEVAFRFTMPFAVHELSEQDSLTLLEDISPLAVAEYPEEVWELIKTVGGLPLALILIGNHLRVRSHNYQLRRISEALTQLKQTAVRLQLAEPQPPTATHPSLLRGPISLQAVIAVSEEELDAEAAYVLGTLAVFPPKPNTFSEEAALAVSQAPVQRLDTLADRGLLESGGPARYMLHQTITDYLQQKPADPPLHERMVHYFVAYIKNHQANHDYIDLEINNISAAFDIALQQGMALLFVEGVNALFPYLKTRGLYDLADAYLSRAQQEARSLADAGWLTTTLCSLGQLALQKGAYKQAELYLQQGLDHVRETNSRGKMLLLKYLGVAAEKQGNHCQSEQCLHAALSIAQAQKDSDYASDLLNSLGIIAGSRGDYSKAETYFRKSLALVRKNPKHNLIGVILLNLGTIADKRGAYEQAETYYQEGLTLAREMNHPARIATFLSNLGVVARKRGAFDRAHTYLQEGLSLARKIDQRERICSLLLNLGAVAEALHSHEQAEQYLQDSLAIARTIDNCWLICDGLIALGNLYLTQADWPSATAVFQEVFTTAHEADMQEFAGRALYGLARTNHAQALIEKAQSQARESLEILNGMGHGLAKDVAAWLEEISVTYPS